MLDARRSLLHPRTILIVLTVLAAALVALVVPQRDNDLAGFTATRANPVTPTEFTGLGFDQCQAPKQSVMDTWLKHSPYRAVGIYISGDSRACRKQTYLNAAWVSTQLAKGWELLPIALGPQASCQPRFPRYADDFKISASKTNNYAKARSQGTAEAIKSVNDAKMYGLTPGSTIFYDLEGFDYANTACRESALQFVSAWNAKVKALGYRTGLYSGSASGIKMVDRARINKTAGITLPDILWIARWDGKANTSDLANLTDWGWQGGRVKQFVGDTRETWGKVTINIDRNYLDLRYPTVPKAPGAPATKAPTTPATPTTPAATTVPSSPARPVKPVVPAETHCGGIKVDAPAYVAIRKPTSSYTPNPVAVRVLTCLLAERTNYKGPVSSAYSSDAQAMVRKWRQNRSLPVNTVWTYREWMGLMAKGPRPALKRSSTGQHVRDVQRALNASNSGYRLSVTGYFDAATIKALNTWKAKTGTKSIALVNDKVWAGLRSGKR